MTNNGMQGDMIQVDQPLYYTFRGISAIEAARIMAGESENKDGYLMRATIKLLYRYPRKNGAQDLEKAIQCIKMLRDHLYGKEEKTNHIR